MTLVDVYLVIAWMVDHGTGKLALGSSFSRQGKHGDFICHAGKRLETMGQYFDCDYG